MKQIQTGEGAFIHLWSSQDALVIKCLSETLTTQLNLSACCTHIKGHGGLKETVVAIQQQLSGFRFVLNTDVKDFYVSIDQMMLLEQLANQLDDRVLLNYLWQIIHRTVKVGGNFWDVNQGISIGCSLSPLFGALCLKALDDAMGNTVGITCAIWTTS